MTKDYQDIFNQLMESGQRIEDHNQKPYGTYIPLKDEVFKQVLALDDDNLKDKTYWFVSNIGTLISVYSGKLVRLKVFQDDKGYDYVDKNSYKIHRMMVYAFDKIPECYRGKEFDVHHDEKENYLENLRVCSKKWHNFFHSICRREVDEFQKEIPMILCVPNGYVWALSNKLIKILGGN